MRRFLFSILLSVTLLTIGTTLVFFEIRQFEFVDIDSSDEMLDTLKVTVDPDRSFKITIMPWQTITYIEDDKAEYDVQIQIPKSLSYDHDKNSLEIENGYSHRYRWNFMQSYFDTLLEGLKEQKVYVYDHTSDEIIITCSKEAKKVIKEYSDFD